MKKIQFLLRSMRTLSMCLVTTALLAPAYAQVYQNDYTTTHRDPTKQKWLSNDAIYRDDAQGVFYVGQTIWLQNSAWSHIGLSRCDQNMNVLNTWEYSTPYDMNVSVADMDELKQKQDIIIIGHYNYEGNLAAPYALSVNKNTGAINWFKLFPDLEALTAVATKDDYIILTGIRELPAAQRIHPLTYKQAVLMRLDQGGNLMWEQDFEDDKYASSGYGINYIYNSFWDVTPIDGDNFVAVGSTNSFILNFNEYWDADCYMVTFDGNGNILTSTALGNILPMDPNGQQALQYERGQGVTFDPIDKTVVITGIRMDATQTHITPSCPLPDQWGMWATKIDPYTTATSWSNVYDFPGNIGGPYLYGLLDNEIDQDNTGQYGITYNLIDGASVNGVNKHYPMITKLDNNGNVVYHRHHYMFNNLPTNDMVDFRDITRSFDFNNMMAVGQSIPDPYAYYSSHGWNVEAYDNILSDCLMDDWPVNVTPKPYDIIPVEHQFTGNNIIDEPLMLKDVKLVNREHCPKIFVSMKPGSTAGNTASAVLQDQATRSLLVTVTQTGIPADAQATAVPAHYKAVLYNAMGQVLLQSNDFSEHTNLDASVLASGIYYLKVQGRDFRQTHTIAIQ